MHKAVCLTVIVLRLFFLCGTSKKLKYLEVYFLMNTFKLFLMKVPKWTIVKDLLLLPFCLSPIQVTSMTIAGQINNPPEQEIKINVLFWGYAMPGDDQTVALTNAGTFSVNLELEEERFVELRIGEKELQLFLVPENQQLTIKVDFEDFEKVD